MFLLPDDSQFALTIGLTDDVGQPTALPPGATVTWGTSDATIVSVTQDPANPLGATVASVGAVGSVKLGTAQVNVSVSLGSGNPITGSFGVQVVGGAPAAVQFTPGAVSPRTVPAA